MSKKKTNHNDQVNYNIEDTGMLMTRSARSSRTRRILIIVAAIIAILLIALLGFKLLGDKRYNDQIKLAEKNLIEGNYEEAETYYLAAIEINKKKVDARKGLAITYVLEEKYEEATEEYEELYEDTDDENYREARDITEEEEIPLIDEVFPSEDLWIYIYEERMPKGNAMVEFIETYLAWTYFESILDESGSAEEDYYFDCDDPAYGFAFPATHAMINDDNYPEYIDEFEWSDGGSDPRGWAPEKDTDYQTVSQEVQDEVYCGLFNVDPENLDGVIASAESKRLMYLDDGTYYQFEKGMGLIRHKVNITKMYFCGSRVLIEYDADLLDIDDSPRGSVGPYYAVMKYKDINGNRTWTMMYNAPDMPDWVNLQPDEEVDDDGEDDEEAAADLSAVYASYAEVLRENENDIKAYWWQADASNEPVNGYQYSDGQVVLDDPVNECVALTDLNGDGIPELLFFTAEDSAEAYLHVFSYDGSKAVECGYDNIVSADMPNMPEMLEGLFIDVNVSSGTALMIYTGKEKGTFYIAYSIGGLTMNYCNIKYTMNDEFDITAEATVLNKCNEGEGQDDYYIDGNYVDTSKGTAAFKKAGNDFGKLIMFSGYSDDIKVFSHVESDDAMAMTYYEALELLEN
ncbi:MAG: hypothetical protein E7230_01510 [Clostridiales bacterium]|nr:hypothetical protein [Clostridiales bacterium]